MRRTLGSALDLDPAHSIDGHPGTANLESVCGRFVAASPPDEIARYFDVSEVAARVLEANFNVAPSTDVWTVLEDGGVRRLEALRWGLVPRWAKDPSIGNRMINARCEGLASKNAFKWAYRKRRCIIPADGFYEWKRMPGQKVKQPYYFSRADGEPLAFAGLWDEWRGPERDGTQRMRSVTIVTTGANEAMSAIHDRMPVILAHRSWDSWLDRSEEDESKLAKLLVAPPESLLHMHPVSTEVNNANSTGSHLVDPVELAGSRPESAAASVQGTLL